MKSTEYVGHSSAMKKDTPWLSCEDLMGHGDVAVIIKTCHHHEEAEFDGGRKEDIWAVEFEGKNKQLVLNSTNRRALVAMFGTSVKEWCGKPVTLIVEKLKSTAFKDRTHGIRVKKAGNR